ncbi:magnesium transporter NIPA-domain-containing protein [Morchella snyderi]|nr:magnesium transporter NIPA-domain-containing protein [Morchella snyderi]
MDLLAPSSPPPSADAAAVVVSLLMAASSSLSPTPTSSFQQSHPLALGADETLRRWSSFIGIVIAICGNILISLALNIQKYAHIRLEREADRRRHRRRHNRQQHSPDCTDADSSSYSSESSSSSSVPGTPPDEATGLLLLQNQREKKKKVVVAPPPPDHLYLSSPYWWVGFVLMTVGECGNFLAYGFAPASIVSPLGVVALVSNCVIAPVVLKEPLRRRDVVGVVVSILGAVVVVWSAEKEETKVGINVTYHALNRWRGAAASSSPWGDMLSEKTEADGLLDQLGPDQILEAISQTAFEVYFGITCAMIVALMYLSSKYGRKTILIDLGLVALFGGYTVLSTKGISSLLSSSFYHIFTYPIAYLFTTILLLTAVLQIKYVNRALQRFDSTQVIPTQFVLFTISVILGSAVLYRDFETVTPERMLKFTTGCALTFWGVWLISSRRSGGKHWDDDYDDDGDLETAYGGTATANIDLGMGGKGSTAPPPPPPPSSSSSPPTAMPASLPRRPTIVRGISASSFAILDPFPAGTPGAGASRMGSYIAAASRPASRRGGEESPMGSVARRGGGGMMVHRKSVSNLLPGPLLIGDWSRRGSEVEESGGGGAREGGEAGGRRRSGSLGVVLDLLGRGGGGGLGEVSGEE